MDWSKDAWHKLNIDANTKKGKIVSEFHLILLSDFDVLMILLDGSSSL